MMNDKLLDDIIDLTGGNVERLGAVLGWNKKTNKKTNKKEVKKNDKQGNTRGTKKMLGISK